MTIPKRNEKLIFVFNDSISIIDNLTKKEVKDFENLTPSERLDFLDEHEEVTYNNDEIYWQNNETTEEEYNKYYEGLNEYIFDAWKSKGTIIDEEKTRDDIELFLYLLSQYRLKCLISTIIDIDDLIENFDEENIEEN